MMLIDTGDERKNEKRIKYKKHRMVGKLCV